MKAEFYIISDTFEYNSQFTINEIEIKIKALADDFRFIKKHRETNKLFVQEDIYYVNLLNGVKLYDLLFNDIIANNYFDRDVRVILKNIIIENDRTSFSSNYIKNELLPHYDENICFGIIAFNKIEDITPEFLVIYDLNGWLGFRRHFLGQFPKNETFYIDECVKYFPNLFFHERNKQTISTIFADCPKKIIYHLAALNDKFKSFHINPYNRVNALTQFSIAANLDQAATTEGNASRKINFTFEFMDNNKMPVQVCCEPHLKLCYNDNYPGDQSHSNNRRIYFHEGKPNIEGGKILIGHIGNHL